MKCVEDANEADDDVTSRRKQWNGLQMLVFFQQSDSIFAVWFNLIGKLQWVWN